MPPNIFRATMENSIFNELKFSKMKEKLFALIWFSNSFTFFVALDSSTTAQFFTDIDFTSFVSNPTNEKCIWMICNVLVIHLETKVPLYVILSPFFSTLSFSLSKNNMHDWK